MSAHRWSGAPGVYCLNCGNEGPAESAINCSECQWSGGPFGMDNHVPCALHAVWTDAMSTCPPEPGKVLKVNALLSQEPRHD
jgi:hypothetical protein